LIERIGGFDERFSPWGFEDDDFTLRAFAAGWWNRIALDVFVHHDTYVGPKLERHTQLLERKWRLFARSGDWATRRTDG
jgi:GT2 family glycosyltransferase